MIKEEIKDVFDKQAAGYDKQWAKTAPINNCLYFLLESIFGDLPPVASVLCIGSGTGNELLHLAKTFPHWTFTAVEPSGAMLDVARKRVEAAGFTSRCDFHEGYLETFPGDEIYDAATCFLVTQFILDQNERIGLFRQIANRLKPGGILASSDLASEKDIQNNNDLLKMWFNVMSSAEISPEGLEKMKAAYAKDVAILTQAEVETIISSGGFNEPVRFYQAGMINAWFAKSS